MRVSWISPDKSRLVDPDHLCYLIYMVRIVLSALVLAGLPLAVAQELSEIDKAIDEALNDLPNDQEIMDGALERLNELNYDDQDPHDSAVYSTAVDCAYSSEDPKLTRAESSDKSMLCWHLCETMTPRYENICKAAFDFGGSFGSQMASMPAD